MILVNQDFSQSMHYKLSINISLDYPDAARQVNFFKYYYDFTSIKINSFAIVYKYYSENDDFTPMSGIILVSNACEDDKLEILLERIACLLITLFMHLSTIMRESLNIFFAGSIVLSFFN